jgi:threonine dehydrogenase-like Zn-dependent dehydrogenase
MNSGNGTGRLRLVPWPDDHPEYDEFAEAVEERMFALAVEAEAQRRFASGGDLVVGHGPSGLLTYRAA